MPDPRSRRETGWRFTEIGTGRNVQLEGGLLLRPSSAGSCARSWGASARSSPSLPLRWENSSSCVESRILVDVPSGSFVCHEMVGLFVAGCLSIGFKNVARKAHRVGTKACSIFSRVRGWIYLSDRVPQKSALFSRGLCNGGVNVVEAPPPRRSSIHS